MSAIRYFSAVLFILLIAVGVVTAESIKAGVGKANISNTEPGTIVNDSLYVKALVADLSGTIDSLEIRKSELVNSLNGTSLNFKTFLTLYIKQHIFQQYPSYYAHQYLHENNLKREDFLLLDEENKKLVSDYLKNIYSMEELTVVKANLGLLKSHQKSYESSEDKLLHAEINGLKIGDFVLITFPGELSTQIGMNIKEQSPHGFTYIAAYTNGYNYYAPTDEQLKNRGGAQEDSECVLGMGWQKIFEDKAIELLRSL